MVQLQDDEARLVVVSGNSGTRSGVSNLKALLDKRRSLSPNDTVVCDLDSPPYQRLPQLQSLKLSVSKLDGSSFEIETAKSATVAELKMAIEEIFDSSQERLMWPAIWGHFCLSYKCQKLISDKATVRSYGIKEGDEIQFTRHMSIDYSPFKTRPKKQTISSKKYFMLTSSKTSGCGYAGQINVDVDACCNASEATCGDAEQIDVDACDASEAACGDTKQINVDACDASDTTKDEFEYHGDNKDGDKLDQLLGFSMINFIRGLLGFAKKGFIRQQDR